MIRVDTIRGRKEFSRLGCEWEEVLSTSGSDVLTATHGWLSAWSETIGRERELLILRVRQGSETIGLAPLMYDSPRATSPLSYRTLTFAPDSYLTSTSDLIIRGDREGAISKILCTLGRRFLCGEASLLHLPIDSPNLEILSRYSRAESERYRLSEGGSVYHIKIGSRPWDEYWRSTSKSFVRKDIARLRNRYAERCGEVGESGASALEGLLQVMARLHIASQQRHGRSSYYQDPAFVEFLWRMAQDESFSDSIRIFTLRVEGRIIAYELGFQVRESFYSWDGGFDPEYERLSPSKYLMYQTLRVGFREGWKLYDLGHGSGHYKVHWGCEERDLYNLSVCNGWGFRVLLRGRRSGVEEGAVVPQV